ncbi:MAG: XdhC family protein [Magnetovibrio sp.]|nr:XdhC family protein [Magnetovibrio sp.]
MNAEAEQSEEAGPDIVASVLAWVDAGHGAALATVIKTWGSSPCPAGSMLAVRDDNAFLGSVSAGCIEGEVVTEALAAIRNDGFRILDFGVSNEAAWQAGLACGGQVRVAVANISPDRLAVLRRLQDARASKSPAVLITELDEGGTIFHAPDGDPSPSGTLAAEITQRLTGDRSGIVEADGAAGRFVHVFNPPLRLFIVGAVHIAQALSRIAAEAGYDVTVIDPRDTWGTVERFPGVRLDRRWPSAALEAAALDARSAVVTLCHDPKLDDPALLVAVKSDAFYIGSLGSRRTHAKRLERLRAEGVGDTELQRVHGPVGLDIGAQTPAEIAVATMAQLTAALRAR